MMSGQAVVFWLLNLLCDTVGQLSLKAASNAADAVSGRSHWVRLAQSPWLWLGLGAFVFEFVFWLSFLSVVPLAMGLFVGSANVICVMVGARFLFGEKITSLRACAIGLIALGIALVGWGKL
jgi:drug/metabolite transporter (DMT)-like permease